jgi:hypothetical protein
MTGKQFLRKEIFHSMLREKENKGFPAIGRMFNFNYLFNDAYMARCRKGFPAGKAAFDQMLIEARKITFNREELASWLYKIKEEAKMESDGVLIRHQASIGAREDQIDFERIGHLTGIYDEAERCLKRMVAIDPLDQNMPHYTVADRLEELDRKIIEQDIVPGYYRVQAGTPVKKHPFELENIEKDWLDELTLAQNHPLRNQFPLPEDFGDRSELLSRYHSSFGYQMTQTKPMQKIKDFLQFHLQNFTAGSESDFLNHIEFRILPEMDSHAGANYPMYQILVREWVREKRTGLSPSEENELIGSLLVCLEGFLNHIALNRPLNDENKYNMVLAQALGHRLSDKHWQVKDQSMGGRSGSQSKKSRAGIAARDLIVTDQSGKQLLLIEALRLLNPPKKQNHKHQVARHLQKMFINEPIGIPTMVLLSYCEHPDFTQIWTFYCDYIQKMELDKYYRTSFEQDPGDHTPRANVKIAKAIHIRESNAITVYHILVNMNA